jgi:hypothetical protein
MAISTCRKCGGHSFALALFTPIGESRKLTLVHNAPPAAPRLARSILPPDRRSRH